jgi:hypothetical protein
MAENNPCRAGDANEPERPPGDSSLALVAALVDLTRALQSQSHLLTQHLTQLTDRLERLTESLVSLLDHVDQDSEDDDEARFDTLS